MKTYFTFFITLVITSTSFAQKDEPIKLNWKISKNENVVYKTVMTDIDTGSAHVDFDGLFKLFSDSTNKSTTQAKEFFKGLNESIKKMDFVTTLTNKGQGVIDIVMAGNQNKSDLPKPEASDQNQKMFMKMMESLNQGVVLRGSVYETGGIHSFWTKSNQKNLIAIFFELPTKPVKVGDSWSIDVNLIANDQNFECDSSYKLNKVRLVELKKVHGENIATVKYDIVEYVKGTFTAPSFGGSGSSGKVDVLMKFTHQALGEFSIDKGRWISYDGIMTLVSSGLMNANKKTKFALIPL